MSSLRVTTSAALAALVAKCLMLAALTVVEQTLHTRHRPPPGVRHVEVPQRLISTRDALRRTLRQLASQFASAETVFASLLWVAVSGAKVTVIAAGWARAAAARARVGVARAAAAAARARAAAASAMVAAEMERAAARSMKKATSSPP